MRAIAVLGGGTMGAGIAHVAVASGLGVSVYDVDAPALERARRTVRDSLEKAVARGKLDEALLEPAWARLAWHQDLGPALAGADFVVEAAPESLQIKRTLLGDAAAHLGPDVPLGSNTSSISIDAIAEEVPGPHRVLGTHFFNPPYVLKLLEIVVGSRTSPQTVSAAKGLGAALGRELIVVQDSPGFATSRLGLALGLEAIRMLEAGVASAEDIDRAMVLGYGHPVGPLALTDRVGLDVRLAIAEYLHQHLGAAFSPPSLLVRMVTEGRLGKKTGQGFFSWPGTKHGQAAQ